MSTEDAILVRRTLNGEGTAFAALIERYADPLTSVAWLLVRHREDAREVVQQAFFEAYRGLPGLREPAKLGGWLRGIVRNLSRRAAARRHREERPGLQAAPRGRAPDPAAVVARREAASRIDAVLLRLDEAHREIFVLHHVEGLKVREVASLTERPEGSVKRILSEARARLRGELIEMAREEFSEYRLTDEQRERLARIPDFPRREPRIETSPLVDPAPEVLARVPSAVFPELSPGAAACFATYDHPGGKLTAVSHVHVDGPVPVGEGAALRYDHVDYGPERTVEWSWAPHYRVEGETATYCAKSFGPPGGGSSLILPEDPAWAEEPPAPEDLRLVPGESRGPGPASEEPGRPGLVVDPHLWAVKIGRRTRRCIRRASGGAARRVDWSEEPVSECALEEFLLPDGRLMLFRRYNGSEWTQANPARAEQEAGWIETLAAAGLPELELFGHRYRLWYDQLPDHAIQG